MADRDPWDPGSPRNRDRTRESKRQLRRLLLEWDPIGVGDVPEAADEYDCLISPLLHQLFSGANAEGIAAWVRDERVEHFGAGPDENRDQWLAESVVAWWSRRRFEALP
jgi:hypothetical protein